jgi:hypothetical protein
VFLSLSTIRFAKGHVQSLSRWSLFLSRSSGGVTPEARQKRAGKKTIIVRGRTCPTLPVALRVLRAARGHTLLSWQFDRRRPCETSIIRSLVPPPPSSPRVVGRYEAWAGKGTTDHSKTREEVTGAWVVDTLLAISILAAPGNLFSRIFLIFPQTDLPTMLIGLPPCGCVPAVKMPKTREHILFHNTQL